MLINHTNIDIQAMLVWLTLPFYGFCSFRSVAVNSVYKLQFFLHSLDLTSIRRPTGRLHRSKQKQIELSVS